MTKLSSWTWAALLLLTACRSSEQVQTITVTLTSVENNDQSVVDLLAKVDGTASVKEVVFRRDGVELGRDNTAPYTYQDNLPSSGQYQYTATAELQDAQQTKITGSLTVKAEIPSNPSQLSGQLMQASSMNHPFSPTPWADGPAQLSVQVGQNTLLQATSDSTGNFTLKLSDIAASALTPLLQPAQTSLFAPSGSSCTGGSVSDAGAQLALASLTVKGATQTGFAAPTQVLPPIEVGGKPKTTFLNSGHLVYASKPVTFSGDLTCGTLKVSLALKLLQGWNKVSKQLIRDAASNQATALLWSREFPEQSASRWVLWPGGAKP